MFIHWFHLIKPMNTVYSLDTQSTELYQISISEKEETMLYDWIPINLN